eukprot:scaffold1351_cov176-Amphora_coffeaeformis.AAC.15
MWNKRNNQNISNTPQHEEPPIHPGVARPDVHIITQQNNSISNDTNETSLADTEMNDENESDLLVRDLDDLDLGDHLDSLRPGVVITTQQASSDTNTIYANYYSGGMTPKQMKWVYTQFASPRKTAKSKISKDDWPRKTAKSTLSISPSMSTISN